MVKNLYIDGIDVRDAFGVWVQKGGYDDLFTFPPMKPPYFNDWPEQHGIEVDLKAPTLAPLSVRVQLIASGSNANVPGFIEQLSKPGYRACRFPTLDREFKLRYSECVDFEQVGDVSVFSMQFELDEPKRVDPATWLAPGVPVRASAYELDGTNFADFGLFVRMGKGSLLCPAPAKQNLTRDISVLDGRIYDTEKTYRNAKEITLQCALKAASMSRLWSCRDAFFNQLIAPGEHKITYAGAEYPVFYNETTGGQLLALRENLVMCGFEIKLTVIR